MARGKKLTFDDDVKPVLKPESIKAKEEFEETVESIKECGTPGDVSHPSVFEAPVETPTVKIEDPKPEGPSISEPKTAPVPAEEKPKAIEDLVYTGPEPAGTNPIAPKLHETKDILTAQMSQRAQEYYDRAMREQFGIDTQQTQDLRTQIAAILKPNPDEDMVKSLVHFEGFQPNYIVLSVQPILLKQAWSKYTEYERPVPGKFMELVFEILNVPSRRYFHKISIVELK